MFSTNQPNLIYIINVFNRPNIIYIINVLNQPTKYNLYNREPTINIILYNQCSLLRVIVTTNNKTKNT